MDKDEKSEPAQLVQMKRIPDISEPDQDPPSSPSYENLGFSGQEDQGMSADPPPYDSQSNGQPNRHTSAPNGNTKAPNGHTKAPNGHSNGPTSPSSKPPDSQTKYLSPDINMRQKNGATRTQHGSSNSNNPDENGSKYNRVTSTISMSSLNFDDVDTVLDEDINLVYSKHEQLPSKDFGKEIRGAMDVQKYLNNMALLIDLQESSPDEIVNAILQKMLDSSENKNCFDQARSALFTHDRVHQLSKTIQGASFTDGGLDYEQNWIISMASIPSLQTRHVGIARLKNAANLGWTCQEVFFVIIILAPTKEKSTKTDLETARTFATIFSDIEFRQDLFDARTEEEFQNRFMTRTSELAKKSSEHKMENMTLDEEALTQKKKKCCKCQVGTGIKEDLQRRLPHYWADYKDGVVGPKSVQKTVSTTFFLYFACVLPSIAFGVLNDNNTKHYLNVEKVFYSQVIGGLFFAVVGGTPQIVLLTTAPLALYTKIIYSISEDFDLDFRAMFCMVGLWNTFFLILYSVFGLSVLMKFSTRSSEEIFALFISIAFSVDAFKDLAHNFEDFYNGPGCSSAANSSVITNISAVVPNDTLHEELGCQREVSMLYLFLLFGTLWIGVTLFNFTKTPFLTAGKREFLADYALAVAVIIMSFFGSYVFRHIKAQQFGFDYGSQDMKYGLFVLVPFERLSVGAVFGALPFGFCLSLLFFMDQNISAALVNAPQNKMKKGTAYHWDLLVIGLVNGVLSLFSMPWVHAALPHSPLHVRALADVEERVDQGHIHQIVVRVRETRLTAIFSHILIGLSILILQYLTVIPTAVLYGLFLYVAVTALYDNQFFERMLLYITEQSAYPPNHYIRRVPQRKIHLFTFTQIVQLAVLCLFGFYPFPYLKMFFPVLIFLLIPARHKIIPKIIEKKYLDALDSH
ncbi:solute carrier family 4 member 11-like [Liolophura sinensis]|uniref:solute carrier family 4 member 11-like n=1 Tax=Liolophura sinensis TaxID=3198878 RepID=UPI003159110D